MLPREDLPPQEPHLLSKAVALFVTLGRQGRISEIFPDGVDLGGINRILAHSSLGSPDTTCEIYQYHPCLSAWVSEGRVSKIVCFDLTIEPLTLPWLARERLKRLYNGDGTVRILEDLLLLRGITDPTHTFKSLNWLRASKTKRADQSMLTQLWRQHRAVIESGLISTIAFSQQTFARLVVNGLISYKDLSEAHVSDHATWGTCLHLESCLVMPTDIRLDALVCRTLTQRGQIIACAPMDVQGTLLL